MMNLFAFFALVTLSTIIECQSFDFFKDQMQSKVKKLATDMVDIYSRRCDQNIISCEIKSYNQCEGTDQKICHQQFPKPQNCLSDGAFLSQTSATRFPNSISIQNLNDDQRHFVCTSAELQNSFKQLDQNRNKQYGISYIGTSYGSIRAYPTFRQAQGNQCADYDPRFRPWYVTATSGGKNIIILIDISGSMDGVRMQLAKDAANSVLNTLSNNDFVGIVTFSSQANYIGQQKIVRATEEKKNILKSQIDSLIAFGKTNYEQAMKEGFRMIKSAKEDQYGANCANAQNIFLFLTDGEPTEGELTADGLISIIDSQNDDINVTMFTYGMGSGIDRTILQRLSCEYYGIMFLVSESGSSSELTTLMRQYYIYISQGISIENPVWTQPYDDFFGFGRMVTVSMPIYYREGTIRKILGVAGIDVVMETFYQFGFSDETQVTKRLISNIPCLKSTLNECQLQQLRSQYKCGGNNCTSSGSIDTCDRKASRNIFLQSINTDGNICCGLTIGALVGILVPLVIILAVAIGCVSYKIKKRRNDQNRDQFYQRKQEPKNNIDSCDHINNHLDSNNVYNNPYNGVPQPYYDK